MVAQSGFPQSWKVMENPGKKTWKHGKVMEFVVFATSEFWLWQSSSLPVVHIQCML